MLPKSIVISADTLVELTSIIKWYDDMPSCLFLVTGDRFHENILDRLRELVSNDITDQFDIYGVTIDGVEVAAEDSDPILIPFEVE